MIYFFFLSLLSSQQGKSAYAGRIIMNQKIMLHNLILMHFLHKQGEVKDSFINQTIGGRSSTGDIGQSYSFGQFVESTCLCGRLFSFVLLKVNSCINIGLQEADQSPSAGIISSDSSPSEADLLPGLDGICNELLQEDGYDFCLCVFFFGVWFFDVDVLLYVPSSSS